MLQSVLIYFLLVSVSVCSVHVGILYANASKTLQNTAEALDGMDVLEKHHDFLIRGFDHLSQSNSVTELWA